jgi:hypothetical protein
MKDFEEMKLARVIDACGGVDGRVKMQKIVYLLKIMGYDLPYDDFTIRQQGPFSRGVACDTDILKGGEIIEEQIGDLGQDEHGEPIRQFTYAVRESFAPLIRKHFDITRPSGVPGIADAARRLKECDRAVLEVAATKVYLEQEGKLEGDALDAELRRLKGHLGSRFKDAEDLLDELRRKHWL